MHVTAFKCPSPWPTQPCAEPPASQQKLVQPPTLPTLLSALALASSSEGDRGLALYPRAQSPKTRDLAHVGESMLKSL